MLDEEKNVDKAPPGVKVPAAKAPAPLDTDAVVEAWFKEFFPNSPVSRDTEAWNLLLRAKDILKQRLGE
jgi:hypothetical protein